MDSQVNLYPHFVPSAVAAIIVGIFILVVTLWHIFKIFSTKNWFGIAFVLAGACTSTSRHTGYSRLAVDMSHQYNSHADKDFR